jgi:TatA/E family protein of Tat protein translocase
VFDLSIPKLLVLAVIALVIFGPNELPKIASQVGRSNDRVPPHGNHGGGLHRNHARGGRG